MADAIVSAPAPMNRREFLFYIWASSMALSLGGATGILFWFAYPRFREGEFGGTFTVPIGELPQTGAAPVDRPEGRFWLVNVAEGAIAIYKVCPHLGCLYKWVPSNTRFECPCHGSKYELDGAYIEGPAPRGLDRFRMEVIDAEGNVLAESDDEGSPIALPPGAAAFRINTGSKIIGPDKGA